MEMDKIIATKKKLQELVGTLNQGLELDIISDDNRAIWG